MLASSLIGRNRSSRILRLEKSMQIGQPVEEVFRAWSDLQGLPRLSNMIEEVHCIGSRSHWRVNIAGRHFEWEAELEQFIPNQSLGWKSISGPKHTGRINFSPLGNDTLVHVTMNYAPPMRLLRPVLSPMVGNLEGYIEKALRDFKASLENRAEEAPVHRMQEPLRATGTFGAEPDMSGQTQHTRFGGPTQPVEFTRPPEAKS
jgi:uncharacterized membrane protein